MKKKLWMNILLVLCMIITCFAGCNSNVTSEDAIFNKTMADFGEDRFIVEVESVSYSEKENFLVYQEGVMNFSEEHLLEQELESGVYVFSAEEEALLQAEKGDIFFIEGSPSLPEGVVAKIVDIQEEGEQIRVATTTEGIQLEDLIEYACIDTEISMANLVLDTENVPEGAAITMEDAEDIALLQNYQEKDSGVWDLAGKLPYFAFGIPTTALENGGFSAESNMYVEMAVTGVHVVFKFSAEHAYLNVGAWIDKASVVKGEGSISGEWEAKLFEWPILAVWIPMTPLCLSVEASIRYSLEGTLEGSYEFGENSSSGVTWQITTDGITPTKIDENDSYQKMDLSVEGQYEAGVEVETGLGIPLIGKVYGACFVGGRITAEETVIEDTPSEEGTIHDCVYCLDGKSSIVVNIKGGAETATLENVYLNKLCDDWKFVWEPIDFDVKEIPLDDFYVSYGLDKKAPFEFGWGECPHKRYKVTIDVKSDAGDSFQNAEVNVTYPDGRVETAISDENGKVEFYLPDGENVVVADVVGQVGEGSVLVEGAPTNGSVKMGAYTPKFYINLVNDTAIEDEMLRDFIAEKYPNVIYTERGEYDWNSMRPGDVMLHIEAYINQEDPAPVGRMAGREYSGDSVHVDGNSYYVSGTRFLLSGDGTLVFAYPYFSLRVNNFFETVGDHKGMVTYALPLEPGTWSLDMKYHYELSFYEYSYNDSYQSQDDMYENPVEIEGESSVVLTLHPGSNAAQEAGNTRYTVLDTWDYLPGAVEDFVPASDLVQSLLDGEDNAR